MQYIFIYIKQSIKFNLHWFWEKTSYCENVSFSRQKKMISDKLFLYRIIWNFDKMFLENSSPENIWSVWNRLGNEAPDISITSRESVKWFIARRSPQLTFTSDAIPSLRWRRTHIYLWRSHFVLTVFLSMTYQNFSLPFPCDVAAKGPL